MKVNLKPANVEMLFDFAKNGDTDYIQGSKLFAMLRLMDIKGELITSNEPTIDGLKALPLKNGYWIVCKKTTFKFGCFALKTYLLGQE